jgi:hypothetical protein
MFDRSAEVYARLQEDALSTGFAVVGGSDSASVRRNHLRIHHGKACGILASDRQE